MWLFILLGVCSPHWMAAETLLMKARHTVDLSGLNISEIKAEDLVGFPFAMKLDLSNNLLGGFNLSHVSGMQRLERLLLSHNRMTYLSGSAVELHNLKVIDLSYNDFEAITEVHLRYLPTSVQLLVEGNERLTQFHGPRHDMYNEYTYNVMSWYRDRLKSYESLRNRHLGHLVDEMGFEDTLLCMKSGIVEVAGISVDYDVYPNCSFLGGGVPGLVRLRGSGIKRFKAKWWVSDEVVEQLDLSENGIAEITPELFNDLPSTIKMVNLTNNPISIIKKNVIDHRSLESLLLTVEGGSGIENGVFEKTNLSLLSIESRNDLDVNFIKTLPTSLTKLFMESCNFVPFDEHILSNLKSLEVVALRGCSLKNLPIGLFAGLNKLKYIYLPQNSIENIEVGTFDDNVNLEVIFLSYNNIKTLPTGLFRFNPALEELYAKGNDLTKISTDIFSSHQEHWFYEIDFEDNKMKEIEENALVNLTTYHLDLRGNELETIKSGAFRGATIWQMVLGNNLFRTIDEGFLSGSEVDWLYMYGNPLKTLKKNSLKSVSGIYAPEIENIESGALYGCRHLQFNTSRLKSIPGDIFKDVPTLVKISLSSLH